MRRLFPVAMAITTLASVGCSTMRGKVAPDFELTAMDGQKVRLSSYRGKPVVLAFWAFG